MNTGNLQRIPSRPTTYKGCRFRSRLEARWAVFFDWLHIEWQYEPEKIHTIGGFNYIPDFRLPIFAGRDDTQLGVWIEIKPSLDFVQEYKSRSFARTQVDNDKHFNGYDRPIYYIGDQDFRFYQVYTSASGETWFPEKFIMRTKKGRWSIQNNCTAYGKPVDIQLAVQVARSYKFQETK